MPSTWKSFVTLLAAATSAFADCSSLGSGASDSFPGSFKFVAFDPAAGTNQSLTLANSLTAPGTSFYILSANGGSSNGFSSLTLSGGSISSTSSTSPYLAPIHSLGAVTVNPSYPVAASGPWLTWSNTYSPPSGIFCAVPNVTPGGPEILAAYGHIDLFFLCTSYLTTGGQGYNALLYNASTTFQPDSTPAYYGSTCKGVTVYFVPV
ncbi:hypothetical protein PHLGIDRAFT_36991 [Phlebiopsis gigantea 11061_1 CR5-6]|uniref:Uncharacterized protein n=1 Tax=Phlebiopsis gigantea (strain 11061_1 CR5-6) TaxID=745531 RepID=A0A0C3NHP5_PHLG1|nr:hypothetical protein PHLGIDRAFT_36991 [Phlebiopsis gigantea 11061_1 CR5-6]